MVPTTPVNFSPLQLHERGQVAMMFSGVLSD
jgi:hypothetical protein